MVILRGTFWNFRRFACSRSEDVMAVNKPVGDSARKGAVRKRSQLKTKMAGKTQWTKRSRKTGAFMATKKTKKFKGVRRETAS